MFRVEDGSGVVFFGGSFPLENLELIAFKERLDDFL